MAVAPLSTDFQMVPRKFPLRFFLQGSLFSLYDRRILFKCLVCAKADVRRARPRRGTERPSLALFHGRPAAAGRCRPAVRDHLQ